MICRLRVENSTALKGLAFLALSAAIVRDGKRLGSFLTPNDRSAPARSDAFSHSISSSSDAEAVLAERSAREARITPTDEIARRQKRSRLGKEGALDAALNRSEAGHAVTTSTADRHR